MSNFPAAQAAAMPPAAALGPQYTVQEGRHGSVIQIGQWTISSCKKPILNGKEIDAAEKALKLPLPEMTFGNNTLTLAYNAGAGAGSTSVDLTRDTLIKFHSLGALAGVATGEGWEERVGGGVLVSMAEQWSKGRAMTNEWDVPLSTKPVRPHDWTYSTTYGGEVDGPHTFEPSETHEIPLTLLARQDPVLDRILYYDDVSLFEDELHDNGESILNVRIRVMPHSFFVLSRLFVRVDNVLFRIYDVRMYHEFGSGEIIRESSGLEADYDDVKRRLEKPDDLSPLTDPNFVYHTLGKMAHASSASPSPTSPAPAPSTTTPPLLVRRSSSRVTGKPWPGLGRKVEVLRLPNEKGTVDGTSSVLEKLAL